METARGSAASLTPAGLLVFAGSAERDVAFAKAFWNSVTLQPPLESRLGPAGPRPRETRERPPAFPLLPPDLGGETSPIALPLARGGETHTPRIPPSPSTGGGRHITPLHSPFSSQRWGGNTTPLHSSFLLPALGGETPLPRIPLFSPRIGVCV
uniref:Cilia- and flagella-associated protein HOATZ n=1 Tax=Terrapene triunguis TaxID=2587831 RepID=A0A674IKP2_9SAUR